MTSRSTKGGGDGSRGCGAVGGVCEGRYGETHLSLIPAASASSAAYLSSHYSDGQGRFIVSARPFPPGTLLHAEAPAVCLPLLGRAAHGRRGGSSRRRGHAGTTGRCAFCRMVYHHPAAVECIVFQNIVATLKKKNGSVGGGALGDGEGGYLSWLLFTARTVLRCLLDPEFGLMPITTILVMEACPRLALFY